VSSNPLAMNTSALAETSPKRFLDRINPSSGQLSGSVSFDGHPSKTALRLHRIVKREKATRRYLHHMPELKREFRFYGGYNFGTRGPLMRTVNAAKFKDEPNTYLKYAKAGEVVVIQEGKHSIAKLIPFADDSVTTEELEMAAAGIILLPELPWNPEEFLNLPFPKVKGNAVTQALLDERNQGR
jgi:antitoxin (DNA-binding transcriptional repressor) of toxin-antitoxin stability system